MSDFPDSFAPVRKVEALQLGVMSAEEIKAMSVMEVISDRTYEDGKAIEGGLMDLRMGVASYDDTCGSCSSDRKDCPGHFAHIALAKPILHPGFVPIIQKILRCVCFHCSTLLCNRESKKAELNFILKQYNGKKRLDEISKISHSIKNCAGGEEIDESAYDANEATGSRNGCGSELPSYSIDSLIHITRKFANVQQNGAIPQQDNLSAEKILEIFSKMEPNTIDALGFDVNQTNPCSFIITMMPVCPPAVRPSVEFAGGTRSSDDLTYKYVEIVKVNNQIRRKCLNGTAPSALQEDLKLLQYHVATLFDNDKEKLNEARQKSGKKLKSIRERLVGKGGRVRGNLMGKRVNFSARTVISGDPNLPIDHVGVPFSIAKRLTFPERVTRYNIEHMRQLVQNGVATHPGACYVKTPDGDVWSLEKQNNILIDVGYIVERHIRDGDVILFNRQPSLHKMSIMAHKIKVMPYSTFRLNLCCTSPYNADFDGDEMNLHVPQTVPVYNFLIVLCVVFIFSFFFFSMRHTIHIFMWWLLLLFYFR